MTNTYSNTQYVKQEYELGNNCGELKYILRTKQKTVTVYIFATEREREREREREKGGGKKLKKEEKESVCWSCLAAWVRSSTVTTLCLSQVDNTYR